ncbi:hypothetical protein EDB87DRAFT_1712530 [Lactarius vividus]|nr:hypothetical protein EDB87DRAFT_1712530 [Lactarius vividus]
MVDWHDPITVIAEYVALVKLVHVIGGIYIWETVSYLGFEYSVISRKRKFTWSFLLYLGCRWWPLISITFQFLGLDVSHKIDCQMSAYISFMCASALIILRVAVLWNRNKIVIAFACAIWIGNTASLRLQISILSTFSTDLILLILMLTGLKRWKHAPRTSGFWWLLCTQGLIWIMIVTLAEVPPTVFILLNLNRAEWLGPMSMVRLLYERPKNAESDMLALKMFQPLGLIIAPLGAARLYRGLIDYAIPDNLAMVVNEPHGELVSPFSHQTCRTKQHDAEGGSAVLDSLAVKTSGSEIARGETFEGGNVV